MSDERERFSNLRRIVELTFYRLILVLFLLRTIGDVCSFSRSILHALAIHEAQVSLETATACLCWSRSFAERRKPLSPLSSSGLLVPYSYGVDRP